MLEDMLPIILLLLLLSPLLLIREGKTTHGRFPDGRKYYITPRGTVGLDLDDEQTRKVIGEKMKEIDDAMRKSQPQMYDKDGKFIGGELKGYH